MTLIELQQLQEKFDAENWQLNSDELEKLRHITLHTAVLLGKLGRYCERQEHSLDSDKAIVVEEVIPDLLIYALQLANLTGENLENLYHRRLEVNRRRGIKAKARVSKWTGNDGIIFSNK
jgi:hypothetical protein